MRVQVEKTLRRCKHRSKKIAWCTELTRFCDAPREYETCGSYEPKGLTKNRRLGNTLCPNIERCEDYQSRRRYRDAESFRCRHKERWSKCPVYLAEVKIGTRSVSKRARAWR